MAVGAARSQRRVAWRTVDDIRATRETIVSSQQRAPTGPALRVDVGGHAAGHLLEQQHAIQIRFTRLDVTAHLRDRVAKEQHARPIVGCEHRRCQLWHRLWCLLAATFEKVAERLLVPAKGGGRRRQVLAEVFGL